MADADAPDLDAEQDVDLRRHWDRSPATGGCCSAASRPVSSIGYLISLGGSAGLQGEGGRLPRPAALAGRRAGAEPGDEPVDRAGRSSPPSRRSSGSPATPACRPGQLRGHISTQAVTGNITRLGQNPLVAITVTGHAAPAGSPRSERPGDARSSSRRAGELLEDQDREPAARWSTRRAGGAEHARHATSKAQQAALTDGSGLSTSERLIAARPAQRPAAAAADDRPTS